MSPAATAVPVPLQAKSPFEMRIRLGLSIPDTGVRSALKTGDLGFLHSFTTGSAVDGPGLRLVAWTTACMFRCRFCHNPDTWHLKDELVRRGKVYYGKLAGARAMFIAPRMIPHFHAIWGLRRTEESRRLSRPARAILRVLRHEWEMATSDLRDESGVKNRHAFTRALDELQAAMLVVPSDVLYQPRFTYIWTLGVGRFPEPLLRRVRRQTALCEVARCFLTGAGMTVPGELARVTGVSRPGRMWPAS